MVHACKCGFIHGVPMIISPTSYLGVEFFDQVGGRRTQGGFDRSSDVVQEGFHILLRRLDAPFSVWIPAHIVPKKIKAIFHVRDDCLRGRKLKPSFSQKLLDQGFDISFQQFFRFAGDDEVIRITDEIHRGILTSKGLERPSGWIFLL